MIEPKEIKKKILFGILKYTSNSQIKAKHGMNIYKILRSEH